MYKKIKSKLLKVTALFLLLSTLSFGNTAYIASFNTLRLGSNQKDYIKMARALKDFDVVALIEVMNIKGLESLIDRLEEATKDKYGYVISPYAVGDSSYKEYYAFIWKKSKVSLVKELGFFPDKDNSFTRPPFAANFKIGNFDFIFIGMHSIFGKTSALREAEAMGFSKLYRYFQDLDKVENDILIGGDFNLSATHPAFLELKKDKDNIIFSVDPNLKTTIGPKGFVSSYDNIFISKNYTTEFTGRSGVFDFTNGDYKFSREKISDHLPVFIEVNTDKDDD